MIAQPVELVKYADGRNDTMRVVVNSYGVSVEHSRNDGESWKCQAVINLEQAIEFAKNLIALVESMPVDEDEAYDRYIEEMAQRYQDGKDNAMMMEDVEF